MPLEAGLVVQPSWSEVLRRSILLHPWQVLPIIPLGIQPRLDERDHYMTASIVLAQAGGSGKAILTIALAAIVYLIVIRFMDLNEKESFSGIALVFLIGGIAGVALRSFADTATLELETYAGPVIIEGAKFVALAVGLAILGGIGRSRGWSEMGGVMDGVVYGATAGLGLATGASLVAELTLGDVLTASGPGDFATIALYGLSEGLFGAAIGAGFGAAVVGGAARRVTTVIVGYLVAVGLHIGYVVLARGSALASQGYSRTIIALLVPVAFVLLVVLVALGREKRAIRRQLADEAHAGVVSESELKLLDSFLARRGTYMRAFFKGDFSGWMATRALHNRQVQLALAEQRAERETEPDRKARIQREIEALRAAILEAKAKLGGRGEPQGGGAA